ncbi:MAG: hypothetical protein M3O30_03200 [Planctomycetota bacterium]|nr:hypothetical protein [Planctomycetota bacterium]
MSFALATRGGLMHCSYPTMAARAAFKFQLMVLAVIAFNTMSTRCFGQVQNSPADTGPATQPAHTLQSLFDANVVDGLIKIESDFSGSTQINGFDNGSRLNVLRDKNSTLTGFTLDLTHTVDGLEINENIRLYNNRMSLSRNEFRPTGFSRTILLNQTSVPRGMRFARQQPRFTLRVFEDSAQGGRTLVATVRADSFDELVKYNQDEVEEFVRPMLRDMEIEYLMPPADLQAIQVFEKESPIDPRVTNKVQALVRNLDADSAEDRDAATKQLVRIGAPAVVLLLRMDHAVLSPEQLTRINSVCGEAKLVSKEQARTLKKDVGFLISCLSSQDRNLRIQGLKTLEATMGTKIEFDVDASAQMRSDIVEKLRAELQPQTRP